MRCVAIIICFFFAQQAGAQQPLTEAQKIDHLILFVRNLQGATFIRNGQEHTPAAAADHLQMKREKAGSRIKTAKDFIDKIATQSSMSGELYMIKFSNGKQFPCQMVLMNELSKLK